MVVLGDILGAEQVNLLPRESPQDVYGGVAKLVSKRVEEDAANGIRLGALLKGRIDRKIVKQTGRFLSSHSLCR